MVWVSFIREGKRVSVPEGTTVLEAEIQAGLMPDAPCGGKGKCGKCLVQIDGKTVKACQTKVTEDTEADTRIRQQDYAILTEGFIRPMAFCPDLAVSEVCLDKPETGEKRSDWERLAEKVFGAGGTQENAGKTEVSPDLEMASALYEMRCSAGEWYAVHTDDEILALRRQKGELYFAAFDIGTTTVVGYLLNAEDGTELAVESRMNPQVQYGADVISRSEYALTHETEALSVCIQTAVNEMLQKLAADADVNPEDIFQVSIVGNTCMHHLFLGISPASLVHAPYTPAFRQRLTLRAADYGLRIHPKGQLLMMPNIAGYVGADTCGCLMTVRPDQREEITLLLDIGTNGEMVLGNKDRLVTCSTAAGPAFEGARITCGMRGAAGAVDHVTWQDGVWNYTTIGNVPPVGLCGSGLIDLVACLLRAGALEENGRWTKAAKESGRLVSGSFMLVPPQEAGTQEGVYLTQKDVGEVQLAKAAIAAGIQLLMRERGVTEEDIAAVYIAGAFGNYMDPVSAAEIGILPRSLAARVRAIGNAAGEGAKIALVNREERREADTLAGKVDFIELAASSDFQDYFVDELEFDYD